MVLNGCAYTNKITKVPVNKPEISKTILQNQISDKGLKRKVAIARFTNESKNAQGFFYDKNNDPLGKQALDILSAKLAATDKFILLERADLNKIYDELKINNASDTFKVNADYLLIGSITSFGRSTTGDVGVFNRSMKQTVNATVSIRLVDVYTGQIIYSEEGSGEAFLEVKTVVGVGGRADYDQSLDDKAITAAISKLVNNVIQNLLDKPWRAYIIDFSDGNYLISGGKEQGIKIGNTFNVYLKGKKVKNPQTGMYIELPGAKIGSIKVLSTVGNTAVDEISICQKQEGELPTANFSNYYIQEIAK